MALLIFAFVVMLLLLIVGAERSLGLYFSHETRAVLYVAAIAGIVIATITYRSW